MNWPEVSNFTTYSSVSWSVQQQLTALWTKWIALGIRWMVAILSQINGSQHTWWRRQWHPTPVLLPGKPHGQRSLVGCSPGGREESDTTERLHFHLLSCIGEGNGNPLQCSCLENPRDGGAWWAAVYGVALIRPQLKWLSSSSRELWSWETILHWIVCYLTTPAVIIRALFHLIVPLGYKKEDFLTLHSHYIL